MQTTDVIIVGGGISGLHSAFELAKRGIKFQLLEARPRLGGRILSRSSDGLAALRYDLGPSWFWPGQTAIESLIQELGLSDKVFFQYAKGDSLFEPIGSPLQRGLRGISMEGSLRLINGWETVIEALRSKILELAGNQSIVCDQVVKQIEYQNGFVQIKKANDSQIVQAKKVILAVPPRIVLESVKFSPELPVSRVSELNNLATWMVGHAKVVCIYERAFWRELGYSGDVISQRGPLAEIHDASHPNSDCYALFGFLAAPPADRENEITEIKQSVITQLVDLFGESAQQPLDILYQDWASNPFVASKLDQVEVNHHDLTTLSCIEESGWEQSLIWSGTEAARGHTKGYLEGAILASKNALESLAQSALYTKA